MVMMVLLAVLASSAVSANTRNTVNSAEAGGPDATIEAEDDGLENPWMQRKCKP